MKPINFDLLEHLKPMQHDEVFYYVDVLVQVPHNLYEHKDNYNENDLYLHIGSKYSVEVVSNIESVWDLMIVADE